MASYHLAPRRRGSAQRPLRRGAGARGGRAAQRREHPPAGRGGLADRRMARQRREEVLPQQRAAADLTAAVGRQRQGALVLRAGAPATQAGTRAPLLRRPLLDRPASARADDLYRLCLSATPAPEGCGAGKKAGPQRTAATAVAA